MSGLVKDNVFGSSGTVAAAAGGLSWSTAVVTGSTVTVEAANGYFINTTSNACTITLPSAAEAGDQIILIDYLRTWGTNAITIDSNGLNFQGDADTYTVDYDTAGQSLNIVYADSTKGWIPTSDIVNAFDHTGPTQKAVFAYGYGGGYLNTKNLVNSSGVIAADSTGTGATRDGCAIVTYGNDKAVNAYGYHSDGLSNEKNLITNEGVIGADTTGVGFARTQIAASMYGEDKGIYFGGDGGGYWGMTNLVTNVGVIGTDVTATGKVRRGACGASYGGDKAFFAYGFNSTDDNVNTKNLVSNAGVMASDASGVGDVRSVCRAAEYGSGGTAMLAYGRDDDFINISNLVNSSGVIAADRSGVGTAREQPAAARYGGDKAVFAYGLLSGTTNLKNLVTNLGVVGADVTGVGTARNGLACGGFSADA